MNTIKLLHLSLGLSMFSASLTFLFAPLTVWWVIFFALHSPLIMILALILIKEEYIRDMKKYHENGDVC